MTFDHGRAADECRALQQAIRRAVLWFETNLDAPTLAEMLGVAIDADGQLQAPPPELFDPWFRHQCWDRVLRMLKESIDLVGALEVLRRDLGRRAGRADDDAPTPILLPDRGPAAAPGPIPVPEHADHADRPAAARDPDPAGQPGAGGDPGRPGP
jgi:hypothetical protein